MSHAPVLDSARPPRYEERFDAAPRYDDVSGLSLQLSFLGGDPPAVLARVRLEEGRPLEGLADVWLHAEERIWWDGLPDRRQADALLGSIALRKALPCGARYAGGATAEIPTILHRPGSPPRISGNPGIHCSVSHDRGAAVAAVSLDPIGVDLVQQDRFDLSVLERIAAPDEAESIRGAGVAPAEVASLLWAAKEAALKGVGIGLGLHPRRVVLRPRGDGRWRAEFPPLFHTPRRWRVDIEPWEGRWEAVARPEAEPES